MSNIPIVLRVVLGFVLGFNVIHVILWPLRARRKWKDGTTQFSFSSPLYGFSFPVFYHRRCFCKLSPVYTLHFLKLKIKAVFYFLIVVGFWTTLAKRETGDMNVQSKWETPLVSG